MTESIDASVVIPTHSERRWASLQRTVASAQQQKTRPAEIIVVVDHNPAMFERVKAEFPGVTVLENTSLRGASGNRNTGAFHSRSELIAFLDDDTVAHPTWLGRLAAPFADPAVVGAGGLIMPAWERRRPSWLPDELLWTVGVSYAGMPTSVAEIRNVWSASMMIRRAAFEKVGGFRVGFGKLGDQNRPEDTELCLRMTAGNGGHWMYVPSAVIRHEVPATHSSFGFFVRRCYAEGRGKVAMAGLLKGTSTESLDSERGYLMSLPKAFVRNLGRGRLRKAGGVFVGVAAAGWGGVVETVAGKRTAASPVPAEVAR
jgi:glucosyl-dolichyl phosphate glucuronosyltransferase